MRLFATIVSIILILSSFASCGGPTLGGQTDDEIIMETDEVFKYLSNTYYKITTDKKLNVAFLGGSVTDGYGSTDQSTKSWVFHVTKWLKNAFPTSVVSSSKLSIGGTGSYLADFRFEQEVKPKSPDLLFVEYAINDLYNGRSYEETLRTSETLVQKAYAENPYMDIIYILIFDKERGETAHDTLRAHKDVAEKYGFMCITMSKHFYSMLKETGDDYFKYFADVVHPNDAGYEYYASVIINRIKANIVPEDETVEAPTELKAVTLPEENLSAEPLMLDADMIYSDKIDLTGSNGWEHQRNAAFSWLGSRYRGRIFAAEIGARFEFEFEGTDLGLLYGIGPEMGTLTCTVDGGKPVIINATKPNTNPTEAIIAWNLPKGKHTVVFELTGATPEGKSDFEIGAILVN